MSESSEPKHADRQSSEPISRTATEARQGEIILGKRGRLVWIGSFALIVVVILVLGLWW